MMVLVLLLVFSGDMMVLANFFCFLIKEDDELTLWWLFHLL